MEKNAENLNFTPPTAIRLGKRSALSNSPAPTTPGRGRPPIPPESLRDRKLEIRLNAAEAAALAEAGGSSVSTWARDVLLRAARRAKKQDA